jgi:CRISPR-associated protein Csy3
MSEVKIENPSVLAFERKLDPSDGLFTAGSWNDRNNGPKWQPVTMNEKSVRGTISNRLKTKDQDAAKLDASIQSPNLQTVDVAMLPQGTDTLCLRFTLKVLGGAGTPSTCNNMVYQQQLKETVDTYVQSHGYSELARRYAQNIANGRFLWRNRLGAESIEVHVNSLKNGAITTTWTFTAMDYSLRNFDAITDKKLTELAHAIEVGLRGESFTLFEVVTYARIGDAQEVYPSQELILDKGTGSKKGQKSKTLYAVNDIAALHSQKIGNALRTIDTWYNDSDGVGPIAVEPYGSVTSRGKAYRQPKEKLDFYTLLDNWILKGKTPEDGQQHYVMATLIRGGVFGEKE